MAIVSYLKWLGIGAVLVAATWMLTRRVSSPTGRLALRCLAISAAVTPQPLWVPGEGGAVMSALALLLYGGAPGFSFAMGAFPILAVTALFFALAGRRLGRAASGGERLAHQATRCWALVGLLLPLLALAVTSPFLAYFLFGGPISAWGTASAAALGGAAVLDWRAARLTAAGPEPRRLRWATYVLGALLLVALMAVHARRFAAVP